MRLFFGAVALAVVAAGVVAGAAGLQIAGGPGQVISAGVIGHSAPDPLVLAVGDDAAVELEWAAVAGATSYRLLRSDGGPFTLIATLSVGDFDDTTVVPGGSYSYRVYAVGADGAVSDAPAAGSIAVPLEP
ncbi:MAG: hypothetical protein O3A10_00695 [Chloroflexi bacterium]|nr:hypothetical protein [Chloroflexota bacterium]MDA1146299.1 hypothetical protein [Chloroflexota bacterium]